MPGRRDSWYGASARRLRLRGRNRRLPLPPKTRLTPLATRRRDSFPRRHAARTCATAAASFFQPRGRGLWYNGRHLEVRRWQS